MPNYDQELKFAKSLALQAGEIMLKYLPSSTKTVKENTSPVTEADIAISKLLNSEVEKKFPTYAVLDEEIKNTIPTEEFVWVCDPVDGTIPFAQGVPNSMFSLALCHKGKPVVGVCYEPVLKKMFSSVENGPTYLNDEIITVNEFGLERGEFILAIPYWFANNLEDKKFDLNMFHQRLHERGVVLSQVESCVYSAMLVASGKIVAAVLPSAYPWDRAASKLIVENAGGQSFDEKGQELTVYGKHGLWISANQKVKPAILDIINACLSAK